MKTDEINDSLFKISGHFKVVTKDETGVVIDTYEHKNTIMDAGRSNVMSWLHSMSNNTSSISRLVLGTGGYDGGASPAAFASTRTNTFSEANANEYYYLDFLTSPISGVTTIDTNAGKGEEGAPAINSVVTVTQDDAAFTLTYNFEIPQSNANGTGVRGYNEAAMYCNNAPDAVNRIFAMRTYPIRSKDSSVSFSISWVISFG